MEKPLDNHYAEMGIEPIVYSDSNKLDPYQHTVIKYVTRWRVKGGLRDLKAAALILQKYINKEEALLKPEEKPHNETIALNSLIHAIQVKGKKYNRIVSTGRGGAWAAANLAYALGITDLWIGPHEEVIQIADEETLFVDGIVDTGDTIQSIMIDSASLFTKATTKKWPTFSGEILYETGYVELNKSQEFDNVKEQVAREALKAETE